MNSLRTRLAAVIESRWFQRSIIALILVNAAVLGLETYPGIMRDYGEQLNVANTVIVGIFVVEIVLRIFVYRKEFFKDAWSLFDLFVVVVAVIPAGSEYAVLRILRLLRVLRLLSAVRSMRVVVGALATAIPGILSIGGLLVMVLYVFAVSSATLFTERAPEAFGDLWRSTASLFRIMVADGWSDIVTPLAQSEDWVYGYFIFFTIVTTFIVLNLFVAVTVDALNRKRDEDEGERMQEAAEAAHADISDVDTELQALRAQLARVEAALAKQGRSDGAAHDDGTGSASGV